MSPEGLLADSVSHADQTRALQYSYAVETGPINFAKTLRNVTQISEIRPEVQGLIQIAAIAIRRSSLLMPERNQATHQLTDQRRSAPRRGLFDWLKAG